MMLYWPPKARAASFPFTEGDALALPFADDTFDAASSGFMMRNVVDVGRLRRAGAGGPAGRPRRLPGDHPAAHAGLRPSVSSSTSSASSRSWAG